MAEQHAEQTSPQHFYDHVGLGALRLAATAQDTVATAEHRHRVVSGMERVIDELRDSYPPPDELPLRVACIGGRWAMDSLAADMAAHVLTLNGVGARVLQLGVMSSDYFARLDLRGVEVICLSYFSPDPTTLAKYFVRRLKRRWPDLQVVLAAWSYEPSAQVATRWKRLAPMRLSPRWTIWWCRRKAGWPALPARPTCRRKCPRTRQNACRPCRTAAR